MGRARDISSLLFSVAATASSRLRHPRHQPHRVIITPLGRHHRAEEQRLQWPAATTSRCLTQIYCIVLGRRPHGVSSIVTRDEIN